MAYSKEVRALYNNLVHGEKYGKFVYWNYYHNRPMLYPYFDNVLYTDNDKSFIHWSHYGSSANKCSIRRLQWILTNIFHLSAKEFLDKYISYTEYTRIKESVNQCITEQRLLL